MYTSKFIHKWSNTYILRQTQGAWVYTALCWLNKGHRTQDSTIALNEQLRVRTRTTFIKQLSMNNSQLKDITPYKVRITDTTTRNTNITADTFNELMRQYYNMNSTFFSHYNPDHQHKHTSTPHVNKHRQVSSLQYSRNMNSQRENELSQHGCWLLFFLAPVSCAVGRRVYRCILKKKSLLYSHPQMCMAYLHQTKGLVSLRGSRGQRKIILCRREGW